MTDVGRSVIFWSKVSVAKNCLQSFEQAGCWCHSLDLSVALRKQCWFLPPKMRLTFYKEICATFRYCGNKRSSQYQIKSVWKNNIVFAFTLHPGYYMLHPPCCISMWSRRCVFVVENRYMVVFLCQRSSSNKVCHHFHPVLLIYSCNQSFIHIFLCKQYTLMH